MGSTLTGNKVKDTYDSLLKLTDNDNLTGSQKAVTDGLGNDTPLSLSTTEISSSVDIEATGFKTPTGTSTQLLVADGSVVESSTIGGGSVGGTGLGNKIAFWSNVNTLSYDTSLHWDDTNNYLGIGTASPSALLEIASTGTGDSLLITNDDATSSAAPVITLKRDSATPADGDYLGQLKFKGENSTGGEIVYAKITAKISDVTAGTEDGLIETAIHSNSSNVIVSRQTGTDLKLINGVGLQVDGDTGLGNTSPTQKLHVTGSARVTGAYYDSSNSAGTSGQVLSSTGTGTQWTTSSGGGGGASELNDLTDVSIGSFTSALINVPSGGLGSYSFVMGIGAGNSMSTGAQSNTFIGYNAGNASDGDNHVMIGAHAGERNAATVAFGNVMIGRYAGRGATGSDAHSTIAIGESALEAVEGGDRNVAVGWTALRRLTTGGSNVAIGNEAGEFLTTNSNSVIIGYQAMENSNSGQCVVIGSGANDIAVTNFGTGAIHIGYQAGRSSTGNRRVNIGWNAGYSQTTGGGVNLGERAGYSNTSASGRTCIGGYSSQYNTGSSNTFVGEYSGRGTSGSSSGGQNTGVGYQALENISSGSYNATLGYQAGEGITTGAYNTILGGHSGNPAGKLTTGDNNVIIGVNAQASSATVSDEVSIYNSSVYARFQGSATAWTFVSDERDKKDIEDLELGLDFVEKLKPRKFKWDLRSSDKYNGKEASGFIAQEIKEVLDEIGGDYTGIVNTDDPNQYTVAQANIIPMLVKAIQELKEEIEILKS